MQTLRFGIIGGGMMGREFASALARWCHLPDFPVQARVTAVCSRRSETLPWFRQACPALTQATTDYRELLANPEVDAVYCAVPHNLHEEMYVAALRADKHLLGEKPFGIAQAANRRILEAVAAQPQRVARCASQFAFFPGVQAIVRMIRAGSLGRILEVQCGFLHGSDLDPQKPLNWKRRLAANGEYGSLGDLGLHILHVPLRAGWRPRNVRAILDRVFDRRPDGRGGTAPCETWDNATLLCEAVCAGQRFPLTARTMRIAPGETNTWYLEVYGTAFSARFSTREPRTLETMPFVRGQPQTWRREALGYDSVYPTVSGRIFEFGMGDALLQMCAAFCQRVAAGPSGDVPFDCMTPEETALAHALFTAALESHRTESVVRL